MIRSLRNKFILIASAAIMLVLVIVLAFTNGISYISNYSDIMSILEFITENNGKMPVENPPKKTVDFHVTREIAYETRYFSMILDENNEIAATDYEHIASVTESDIDAFYAAVVNRKGDRGSLEMSESVYFYRSKQVGGRTLANTYASDRYDNGMFTFDPEQRYRLIVFMDCTNRMYRMSMVGLFSIFAGFVCFIIFFITVSVFSKRAIKPTIENYEKQKQFITNAGHELKTPLAIISANTEVIEAVDGKSEWTQSILNQVNRLTGLVNDLITLARLEEYSENKEMVLDVLDLSEKVREMSESFSTLAGQQGKTLETEIEPGIKIKCNEKSIHELISILMDNAVKYCDDGGMIKTELCGRKKQAVFTISNTYKKGEGVDYNRFFERFYRGDTSHNQEKASGYGIGLSMAERIVKLHKGKIAVSFNEGRISFCVTLLTEL